MTVALVTCRPLPEPDPDELLLRDAVRGLGVDAEIVPWDPAPPPETRALWVLRSTWDYHRRLDPFLAFCARTAARSTLLNPLHLVRWNARKTYLRELKQRGVPVVPTSFVPVGGGVDSLDQITRFHGWNDIVIKPAVSAASLDTRRFRAGELAAGADFLAALTRTREAVVQGYLPGVEGQGERGGERALVFIDGVLTHAVRKSPRLAGEDEAVTEALPIADDERALAEMALRPFRDRLLYGRVDCVRDASGTPVVMELELIEPSLFLAQHPPALTRFAAAIVRQARAAVQGCRFTPA